MINSVIIDIKIFFITECAESSLLPPYRILGNCTSVTSSLAILQILRNTTASLLTWLRVYHENDGDSLGWGTQQRSTTVLTLGGANTVGSSGTLFLIVGTVFARSRKYFITIICSSKHWFSFLLFSALRSFRPQFLCTFVLSMPCFSDIHISFSSRILLFPLSICLACINSISA